MNIMSLSKICILILILSTSFGYASANTLSLKKCLEERKVSMKACSEGGYMGKCLAVELKNNTAENLNVKVDPALIFKPTNDKFQHLVAVGEEVVSLLPGEEKLVILQTFCGKSKASSPAKDIKYNFWKQGSKEMVLASKYIKEHGFYNSLGQHAIWMFTDNHCLSNVYMPAQQSASSRAFISYLAALFKVEVPSYYTYHKTNASPSEGEVVFDVNLSKVYVDVFWNKEHRRNTHILVLNSERNLYRTIESGMVSNSKGEHNVQVAFDPHADALGVYFVQLKDDENNILEEKRVVLQRNICN